MDSGGKFGSSPPLDVLILSTSDTLITTELLAQDPGFKYPFEALFPLLEDMFGFQKSTKQGKKNVKKENSFTSFSFPV